MSTQTPEPRIREDKVDSVEAAKPSVIAKRRRNLLPNWFNPVLIVVSILIGAALFIFGRDESNVVAAGAVAAVVFILVSAIAGYTYEGRRYGADRVATAVIVGAFILAVIPLASLLYTVAVNGWERMTAGGYFTATTFGSSNSDAIVGAGHAIVGTLMITGVTALIAIPLGVLTAVYLVEYGKGRFARILTFLVDVMTGIPSIVAGLFAAAAIPLINLWIFGHTEFKNGFMGSIALVVLMTPIVIRNTEEMLRLVPNELREASYALGVTKAGTIVKVVLRTSVSGIISGIVIAVARVIGESAPLLITAGTTDVYNTNLFSGQMLTLPVYVYNEYTKGNQAAAWAGALLLILIVLVLNLLARWIAKRFAPKGE